MSKKDSTVTFVDLSALVRVQETSYKGESGLLPMGVLVSLAILCIMRILLMAGRQKRQLDLS